MSNEWKEAVLEELIILHIYEAEHDKNPRKAVKDAILYNCKIALDPQVSQEAREWELQIESLNRQLSSLPRIGSGEIATLGMHVHLYYEMRNMMAEGTLSEMYLYCDGSVHGKVCLEHKPGLPQFADAPLCELYPNEESLKAAMKEKKNEPA